MSDKTDGASPIASSEYQPPVQISLSETGPSESQAPSQADLLQASNSPNDSPGVWQTQGVTQDLIAEDESVEDDYAESTKSGYATSVASEVRRGVLENGRVYPSYGRHDYGMPIDEQELARNDLQHAKFSLLLGNRLFLAPISSPTRVLDIGTGTGIWAIDVGDVYPEAEVIGTDIAPVQPTWIPPNVQFFLEDAEDMWTFSPDSFSLVFAREMSFAVRDWPNFISQAWTALKPGGWLELSATHPQTQCDDGSLNLKTSGLARCAEYYLEVAEAMGTSLHAPFFWAQQMRDAGFVDIQTQIFKMPLGPW